jgi:hypothetical protein
MNVVSRCRLHEVGFSCIINVTYGILCNGWGTSIILYVPRDNVNPVEMGKYFGYTIYESYDLNALAFSALKYYIVIASTTQ